MPAGDVPELAHDRQREVPRQRRRQSDHDLPDRRAPGLVDVVPRPLDLLQDAAGVQQQALARLGGRGPAAVAQQQALPQFDFEAAYLAADRRLRHAENARGPAEPAEVDDVDEILELFQVHGLSAPVRAIHAETA